MESIPVRQTNWLERFFNKTPTLYRGLLAINRSPMQKLVKTSITLFHLRQKRKRRTVAQSLVLTEVERKHAIELQENGYTILERSFLSESLLQNLHEVSHQKLKTIAHVKEKKSIKSNFWTRLLDEDAIAGRLTTESIYVQFALQPSILRLVSSYFGEVPYLVYVFLTLSKTENEKLQASQLWHRDADDVRVCKLFTYLTDVPDTDHGPFTFIPAPASKQVKNSFIPKHLPDEKLLSQVSPTDIERMAAPKLSSFLVDTKRCYHMGSRMKPGKTRLMYTANFITVPSIYPSYQNQIRVTSEVSELERLVLRHHR